MSEDLIIGIILGGGWGTFLGFFIGVAWFRRLIAEYGEDE